MKLFQSLLVAPAALGLMAPIVANASEVNLNGISNYSDVDTIDFANSFKEDESNENQLIAGGEGLVSGGSYDGGFSETTTASFSTDFYLGVVDGGTTTANEPLQATYGFQIDLNTSFTGEDSLDISLDAGNTRPITGATPTTSVAEFDGNATGDNLVVDGVSYTFPIGDATAFVADNGDASALFTTACTYGGPGNMLDDCGNVNAGPTGGGVAFGGSYDFGNGFTVAGGYQATDAQENLGIMTEESLDQYAFNAAYTADNYGLSITYSSIEDMALSDTAKEDTYTAFNGYFTPEGEGLPSISLGYEIGDDADPTTNTPALGADLDQITSFFLGLQWDEGVIGPGSFGVAMGHSNTREESDEEYQYEAYYSYPLNDGMTITPMVFTRETAVAGRDDATGIMVKTSFSF
jgi:hypothetical protein